MKRDHGTRWKQIDYGGGGAAHDKRGSQRLAEPTCLAIAFNYKDCKYNSFVKAFIIRLGIAVCYYKAQLRQSFNCSHSLMAFWFGCKSIISCPTKTRYHFTDNLKICVALAKIYYNIFQFSKLAQLFCYVINLSSISSTRCCLISTR